MSPGKSIAIDLPMPSGTKREVASLAATWITGTRASAAMTLVIGVIADAASITVRKAVRVQLAIARFPFTSSLRRDGLSDAETNDVDARAEVRAVGIAVL